MSAIRDWTIEGSDGQPIFGNVHLPADADAATGVLVCCHGFKGYKDYGFFPQLAQAAAEAGLIAHRFNFSHSGMTNRIETFERPDLFERDTWGRQMHDLRAVMRAIRGGELAGADRPVVWFGHSRGGVTCAVTAGQVFEQSVQTEQPAGVILAAAPSSAMRLDESQREALRRLGRLPSPSSRTGQTLYVGVESLDEYEAAPQRFDPLAAAARITCPLLVIHGENDNTVPVTCAEDFRRTQPSATVEVIGGASHTFNAPNPLPLDADPPGETAKLIERCVAFANECVGKAR